MSIEQSIDDFIPPFFDLEKYHSLASSSAQEWLTNIVARLPAYYDLSSTSRMGLPEVYGNNDGDGGLSNLKIAVYQGEEQIPEGYLIQKYKQTDGTFVVFEYPSILSGDVEQNIQCGGERTLEIESPTFQQILSLFCHSDKIESLSVSDIVSLMTGIRGNPKLRSRFNTININDNEISSIDAIIRTVSLTAEEDNLGYGADKFIPKTEFEKWNEISDSPANAFTFRWLEDENDNELDYVQIDLSLPDHVLLEQFSDWLAEKRKSGLNTYNHNKKYLTKSKMRLWFDSRVIPYMDLIQWNKSQGRTVPHTIAGQIIFSDMSKNDFRNPAGRIADTTLKHMKEITSRPKLILLASQVINEIGRKK